MFAKPSPEHRFFDTLIGEWSMHHQCNAGGETPASEATGKMSIKSLGGMWAIIECSGASPDGSPWTSQFTLGYDPNDQRYKGTFVGSMMTHLWLYDGERDSAGSRLTLNTTGPRFDGRGMAQYQDIFEIVDVDHWILRSQMQQEDGTWAQFMEGHHYRLS